jgi:hypothetical protein
MALRHCCGKSLLLAAAIGLPWQPTSAESEVATPHAAEVVGGSSPFGGRDVVVIWGKYERWITTPPPIWQGAGSKTGTRGVDSGGSRSGPEYPAAAQTDNPASDNNTSPDCPNTTANPVIIATGEKIKTEVDFDAAGSVGLAHSRTYRSFGPIGRMFGAKWYGTYDYPALTKSGCYASPDYPGVCVPTSVVFTQPDGAKYTYTRATAEGDAIYSVRGAQSMGRLYYDGPDVSTTWRLVRDHKTYGFASNGSIQSISAEGSGARVTFTYGATAYQPIKVANAAGQAIEFT